MFVKISAVKIIVIILFFLFYVNRMFSQDSIVVSGIVYDKNEPLIGTNVIIKGTTIGTVTDFDGKYNIVISPNIDSFTLEYSYIGYEKKEILFVKDSLDNKKYIIKQVDYGKK